MPRKKGKAIDDNFIMSPKYDFVFNYIFGNEKHKGVKHCNMKSIA